MTGNSKIVSRFYVIYGDGKPIYVGYTNRTVKKRFKEHQHDKDFSDFNKVEVKEIDSLSFDFTWNMQIVDENAKVVSHKETSLIDKYGTTMSRYQKGAANLSGGVIWADVKGFVHSNKDNPVYTSMVEKDLLEYLKGYRVTLWKRHNFIIHYRNPLESKLANFVQHYQDPEVIKIAAFISHYVDADVTKLRSFISHYQEPEVGKLHNFITNYRSRNTEKLFGFINSYRDPKRTKLQNFITRYRDPKAAKLQNFIGAYKSVQVTKIAHFIGRYRQPEEEKLQNFIVRLRDPKVEKMHNFIGRYK